MIRYTSLIAISSLAVFGLTGCGDDGGSSCDTDAECGAGLCLYDDPYGVEDTSSCVENCTDTFTDGLPIQFAACVDSVPRRCAELPLDDLQQCQDCGCSDGQACGSEGCVDCASVSEAEQEMNCSTCGCDAHERCGSSGGVGFCELLAQEGAACTRNRDCESDNCSSPHSGPRVCLLAAGTACSANTDCDLCIGGECQQACGTSDPSCLGGLDCSSSGEGFFCRESCTTEGAACPNVVGSVCESRFLSSGETVLRCFGADCSLPGFGCPGGYSCVPSDTGAFSEDRCMPN